MRKIGIRKVKLGAPWRRFVRLRSAGRTGLAAAWHRPPCCPCAAQPRHMH